MGKTYVHVSGFRDLASHCRQGAHIYIEMVVNIVEYSFQTGEEVIA